MARTSGINFGADLKMNWDDIVTVFNSPAINGSYNRGVKAVRNIDKHEYICAYQSHEFGYIHPWQISKVEKRSLKNSAARVHSHTPGNTLCI